MKSTTFILVAALVMAALVGGVAAVSAPTTVQTANTVMVGDHNSVAVSGNVVIGATNVNQYASTSLIHSSSSLVVSGNGDLGVSKTSQSASTTAIGICHSAGGSINLAVA